MTDQERQQERRCNRKQRAEARARLTDHERQHERRHNDKQHRQARGQQDLHTTSYVPLSEFDEASVPVLDIGGRTTKCQQCRAMIWPDETSRGHADLCCAKGRSCSCEALFPIPPPQPLRDLLTSEPTPGARVPLPPYLFASTCGNTIPPCRWPPLALTSSHPLMGSV